MKKSTILLLVVVYIVSFFIIGLLGQAIRGYNEQIYPTSIVLEDPDNKTIVTTDVKDESTGELLFDYNFVYRNYTNGANFRIKATVKPENSTWPNVSFTKDGDNLSFDIQTHEDNSAVEKNFALITLNDSVDETNPYLSATFFVISDNPGTKIKLHVCVTFVAYQLFLRSDILLSLLQNKLYLV